MRAAVAAFAVGVWWLQQQAQLPTWTIILGSAFVSALCMLCRFCWPSGPSRRYALPCLLAAAVGLAGWTYASARAHLRMADGLAPHLEGQDVLVQGWIDDLPSTLEYGERFALTVEQAQPGVPRRLLLSLYGRKEGVNPRLLPGQRWRLTVRLRQPHGNANPHGFDYEGWLLQQGLRATGTVRPNPQLLSEFVWRPQAIVHRVRYALRARMEQALQGRTYAGVIIALVMGDQRAIDASDWQIFNRTGIGHLVSISGLHITMIAGALAWVAFNLWRRLRWQGRGFALHVPAQAVAAYVGAITALVYCLLAGWGVPAQRTFYMLLIVAIALGLQRLSAPSFVLAWALATVLIFDPWAVLAPGFWLSFSAVALIFYVNAGRTSLRASVFSSLHESARIQWAVTVGLAPLTLLLFQQVSVAGPVANALAIPVVSFLVTPLALLGCIASFLSVDVLLVWAHAVFAALMVALRWFAELPFAQWTSAAPSAWAFAMAIIGIVWLLAPPAFPARLLGIGWLLPLMFPVVQAPRADELWITALDVGQGTAVLVEGAGRRLLYDTGPRLGAESDAGQRVILPYLRGRGINHLDALIVSHEDADHVGGADSVLTAVRTDWFASSLSLSHPLAAKAQNRRCVAGQAWQWGAIQFEFLHPSLESYGDARIKDNGRSCVLKVVLGKATVLLAGDIEKKQEAELVAASRSLEADLLFVPHHGSATSSTEPFLDAVRPKHAIVQAGYRNRFGHPKPRVLARYEARNIPVYRTDESGAITFKFQSDGSADISTHRANEPRYWRYRKSEAR